MVIMGPVGTPRPQQNGRTPKNTPGKTPKGFMKTPKSGIIMKQKDRNSLSKATPKMAQGLKPQKTPGSATPKVIQGLKPQKTPSSATPKVIQGLKPQKTPGSATPKVIQGLKPQKTPGSLQKSFQHSPPNSSPNKQGKNTPKPQGKPKRQAQDEEEEDSNEEEENGVIAAAPLSRKAKFLQAQDDEDSDDDDDDDDDGDDDDDEVEEESDEEEEEEEEDDDEEEEEEEDDDIDDEEEEVAVLETKKQKKQQQQKKEASAYEEGGKESKQEIKKVQARRVSLAEAEELEAKGTPFLLVYSSPMKSCDGFPPEEVEGILPLSSEKTQVFFKNEAIRQKILMNQYEYTKFATTDPLHEVYVSGIPSFSDAALLYKQLNWSLKDDGVYNVRLPIHKSKPVGFAVLLLPDEESKKALLKKKKTVSISGIQLQLHSEKEFNSKFVVKFSNSFRQIGDLLGKVLPAGSEKPIYTNDTIYCRDAETAAKIRESGKEMEGRKLVLVKPTEKLYTLLIKNFSLRVGEEDITKFLKSKGIKPLYVSVFMNSPMALVGLANENEQKKLLSLHQTEMEGQRIVVEYDNEEHLTFYLPRSVIEAGGSSSPGRGGGGFRKGFRGRRGRGGFGGRGRGFRGRPRESF